RTRLVPGVHRRPASAPDPSESLQPSPGSRGGCHSVTPSPASHAARVSVDAAASLAPEAVGTAPSTRATPAPNSSRYQDNSLHSRMTPLNHPQKFTCQFNSHTHMYSLAIEADDGQTHCLATAQFLDMLMGPTP